MKNLSRGVFGLLMLFVFSGCADLDFITEEDYLKNEYTVEWLKRYGLINPDQDWNAASDANAKIDPSAFGEGCYIEVYTRNPQYGGALMAVVTEPGEYHLDVTKTAKTVYARVYQPDGQRYRAAKYPIVDGCIDITAASRGEVQESEAEMPAGASRAEGDSNASPYNWIIACEDLGSTGDTDFNDIVLGVTYVEGTGELTITALAAGGIYKAEAYYDEQFLFEIHQGLGLPEYDNGKYPMVNTRSWGGPGQKVKFNVSDFRMTRDFDKFRIDVYRPDKKGVSNAIPIHKGELGTPPQMMCLPGDWEWPLEMGSIESTYPEFKKWNADVNADWYEIVFEGRQVKRNWYPSEPEVTLPTGLIENNTLKIMSTERKYDIYVPENVQENWPVVFSLHGAYGNKGAKIPFATSDADYAQCIVVYPQGLNRVFQYFAPGGANGWNANCLRDGNEDVAFFEAIIEKLADEYNIDRKRIYCCGFSNGGMMTYSLTSSSSKVFAAFAAISGFPTNEFHYRATGYRPVPFLHIHGKKDGVVQYRWLPYIVDAMLARNGCGVKEATVTGNASGNDGGNPWSGQFTKDVYTAGAGGFPYVLYQVENMGHFDYINDLGGKRSGQVMWDFMSQYTLDSSCDPTLKWRWNIDAAGYGPSDHDKYIHQYTWAKLHTIGVPHDDTLVGGFLKDNNLYPSLQFEPGNYELRLSSTCTNTNEGASRVFIALQSLDGTESYWCKKYVANSGDAVMPFSISTYGEYRLFIWEDWSSNKFTKFEIHSTSSLGSNVNCVDEAWLGYFDSTHKTVEQTRPADGVTQMVAESGYNTYTPTGDIQVAFKNENVDISGYDYAMIVFAEPITANWVVSFWEGQTNKAVTPGTVVYKYDFTEAEKSAGTIPQISLVKLWGNNHPAKVKAVYLHKY